MEPAICPLLRDSFASSLLPPPLQRPFSGDPISQRKCFSGSKIAMTKAYKRSDSYSHNFDGKLVDESMIVLRRRIQEMNRAEKNYEPPRHWMEWEKRYKKGKYDVDVCEAVGSLQSKLMETRPGVALGMGLLLLLSLPTSMAAVLFHVMSTWPR